MTNKEPKRVALCFGGHIRDFTSCYGNIKTNLIDPLQRKGYLIDSFVSTWNTEGFRAKNWTGEAQIEAVERLLQPKVLTIEPFDREYFVNKYFVPQWNSLSCRETSGDGASMWWKLWSCFTDVCSYQNERGFTYDMLVRVRFDMLFDSPFNETPEPGVIYMPEWHQKYEAVTCQMMDQFAFGDFSAMSKYMTVYPKISTLIKTGEGPFTAEGFLYHALKGVVIRRTSIGFGVLRPHGKEKVV